MGMTLYGILLDYATFLLALISAWLWAMSARVNFKFGYDMDAELQAAMKKAGRLNASAACFAASAAFMQAIKAYFFG